MSAIVLDTHICAELATMLRRAFGKCAAKSASHYADASHRTAERWVRGEVAPSGTALMKMARHEGFREELRAWCERVERQENEIRDRLHQLRGPVASVALSPMAGGRTYGNGSRGAAPQVDKGPKRSVRRAA